MADLNDFLKSKEWYDNSTLETIDRCVRKNFWKNVYTLPGSNTAGVSDNVGVAAHFGSCIHSGFDKYYDPIYFKSRTTQQRRILAIRAFIKKHHELVLEPETVDNKYSLERGVDLLDMYFQHYDAEDSLYEPIETEIAIVVRIEPKEQDSFTFLPFWYVMRLDAIWRRLSFNDLWITEHKTASSPENKLTELALSRQVRGYYWGANQFPADRPIEGVLANVVAIRAAESNPGKLFYRDFIHLNSADGESFRLQTIHKVEAWRAVLAAAEREKSYNAVIAAFHQTTAECTRYGKCSYYDLCLHGPTNTDLTRFSPNTWNPLYTERVDQ